MMLFVLFVIIGNFSSPRGTTLTPIPKTKGSERSYCRESNGRHLRAGFLSPAPSVSRHRNRQPRAD
eukprot:7148141-Ditylum_brightwellii.AAC.2